MSIHFRHSATEPTLCGATRGHVTAAPRLATCPDCCARIPESAVRAEIVRRAAERSAHLAAFCRGLMRETLRGADR